MEEARRVRLTVWTLCCLLAVKDSLAGATHRFVCVDNGANRLLYVDECKPATNWRVDVPAGSRDLQQLDAEHVLLSHGNGCGIYRISDGKLLWSIDGFQDVQTARYRAERQEIILGANGKDGYEFYVLEKAGDWFRRTDRILGVPGVKSGFLRLVRFTPEGHFLFSAGAPYRVLEWDADKSRIVWSADLPGKGYVAIRREDGTTVATTGGAVSVVVLGRDGKVIKSYLGEGFRQAHQLNWFSGVHLLPNGNLVIANWLGHGANGRGPHLVEVDAQDRIVWTWTDHAAAQQITSLVVLDEPPGDEAGNGDPEFEELKAQLAAHTQWNLPRLQKESLRQESLILESDRTPADIVRRRTAALLKYLKALPNAPDLRLETEELEALAGDASSFQKLVALRRRIAFRNPLLDFDRILFLKHNKQVRGERHMIDQYFGFNAEKAGGVYVLEKPFSAQPAVRTLLEKDGAFISLDLDYDAKSLLFAYSQAEHELPAGVTCDTNYWAETDARRQPAHRFYHFREETCYHLFKMNVDGSGLKPLSDGPWNDFDPCFLPNGRIVFVSTRSGGQARCGFRPDPTYTLHCMMPDGRDIIQLSYHDTNEWQPSVDHSGMLAYTRWDYVDRDSDVAHHPWLCFPDGRDPRSFHGNYPDRRESRPWMEMSIRAIPDSRKYVAVAAPHHGQAYGSLVIIDPREQDDRATGQIRRLTPEVPFPESESAPGVPHERGKHSPNAEVYGTPWPLSEDFYLVVYDAGRKNYGLYLLDSFGNREPLYRDSKLACLDPIPLKPRPRPPVLPARTCQASADRPADADLATGVVMVMNVYDSDQPWPAGTKIKALRVINLFPKDNSVANEPPIGVAEQSLARGVLGTAPVEADGSACFRMPTGASLYFQALDENGLAVHTMRSDTYLHPGETLTCIGCHEAKSAAARRAEGLLPLALRRPPSELQPESEGSYPLTFPRLVQPVLDRHCVACHDRNAKAPSLHGDRFARNGWSESFQSLRKFAWGMSGGNGTALSERQYSIPGKDGARVSKLYRLLANGHHNVELPPAELRRITLWLDCNSNFYGAYHDSAQQARGEIVKPKEGLPKWLPFEKLMR
jgi:hypothetical protein